MRLTYYKIRLINVDILSEQRVWLKAAPDLASAWRKFTTQHFGVLKPNPHDYDIAFDHVEIV